MTALWDILSRRKMLEPLVAEGDGLAFLKKAAEVVSKITWDLAGKVLSDLPDEKAVLQGLAPLWIGSLRFIYLLDKVKRDLTPGWLNSTILSGYHNHVLMSFHTFGMLAEILRYGEWQTRPPHLACLAGCMPPQSVGEALLAAVSPSLGALRRRQIRWEWRRVPLAMRLSDASFQALKAAWADRIPSLLEGLDADSPAQIIVDWDQESSQWVVCVKTESGETERTVAWAPGPEDLLPPDILIQAEILSYQRRHWREQGRFDVWNFPPGLIDRLDPTEQVQLGISIFHEIKRVLMNYVKEVNNDIQQQWADLDRLSSRLKRLNPLNPPMGRRGREEKLRLDISSTVQQPVTGVKYLMQARLDYLARTLPSVTEAVQSVEKNVGGRKVALSLFANEMGMQLLHWLDRLGPLEKKWVGDVFTLKFSRDGRPEFDEISALQFASWPPRLDDDLVWQTYLNVLGWKMTVHEGEDGIVIQLEFNQEQQISFPADKG